MPRSAAQTAASRSNGARSRGPRTAEGKAKAAANSRRHGLCGRAAVLRDADEQAAFDALHMGLRAAYRPVDAMEQELVRAIAHASWQLRRAQALEEDWWRGQENGLSLETILRYQARAECARGRAMRALKLHRSGVLQRKEEAPSPELRQQAARLPPPPLPVPPSLPRTIEPEAYRRLWERYVEQDPGNVLKALIRTVPSAG